MNDSIWNSIVSSGNQGATLESSFGGSDQAEEASKNINFIRFIFENISDSILQEAIKNLNHIGIDYCWQNCWVITELLSGKIFKNIFNYCGLQVEAKWKIEKAARKNSNKI